jgi:hypothetical protein
MHDSFCEKALPLADFLWKKLRFQVWCAGFSAPEFRGLFIHFIAAPPKAGLHSNAAR